MSLSEQQAPCRREGRAKSCLVWSLPIDSKLTKLATLLHQENYLPRRHCSLLSLTTGRAAEAVRSSFPSRLWLQWLWWGCLWWPESGATGLQCCWDIPALQTPSLRSGTFRSEHARCSSGWAHWENALVHLKDKDPSSDLTHRHVQVWSSVTFLSDNTKVRPSGTIYNNLIVTNERQQTHSSPLSRQSERLTFCYKFGQNKYEVIVEIRVFVELF